MAGAAKNPATNGAKRAASPRIYKAARQPNGDVVKGAEISESQAIAERKAGRDVVVCGNDTAANNDLARHIEYSANGSYKRCGAHANAGPNALNHYQPDPRPPDGHTFYETKGRKARKK
jgi:hypothetical protein